MKSPRYWALQPCQNVAKSVTVIFCRNEKPEILGIATSFPVFGFEFLK